MRQVAATAPMTAAAFAGEAFSCARANGTACACANIALLLDAAFVASIFVILGILSLSLLGLMSLLLIALVRLTIPCRLRGWRSRFH